jgi:predicted site-specific integrase-resolvase
MQDRTTAQAAQGEARAFDETQLARRWDISIRTLQQWRRMGIGPIYLKLGNRVSYRREDVEQYERQALRRGTSERAFA